LELLNDKFQDIDLRTIVGPGMGYQIWDDPVKSLAFEAGASYFSDNMQNGEDSDYIAARLGLNFRYAFCKFIVFSDRLDYYPSLENFSTYTLRNEAALTTPLGARWSLKLAHILQYNSDRSMPQRVCAIFDIFVGYFSAKRQKC
jgi:putative salt-induced outer membrane protein YdiY